MNEQKSKCGVPSVIEDVAPLIPPTADNTVDKMEKRKLKLEFESQKRDKLTSNKKTN
jgi:hypothetical protein